MDAALRGGGLLAAVMLAISLVACSTGVERRPATLREPTSQIDALTPIAPTAATTAPTATTATPTATPIPRTKRVSVSINEVTHGPTDQPRLSLVINAGAGFEPAVELLDVLAERGVRTTFFLLGWWVERNSNLVARIADEGHEIASHGHSILDLTAASNAAVAADLEAADAAVRNAIGRSTKPLWSPSAGYRDARVRGIAASLGYRPILWSHDSGDWRVDATVEDVRRRALAGIEAGAIIVFHLDSTRSRTTTLLVLGEVIDEARRQGLEPVTITELIGEEEPVNSR